MIDRRDEVLSSPEPEGAMADGLDLVVHSLHGAVGDAVFGCIALLRMRNYSWVVKKKETGGAEGEAMEKVTYPESPFSIGKNSNRNGEGL